MMLRTVVLFLATMGLAEAQVTTSHPILFVTQFPIPTDFGAIGSVFNNHRSDMEVVGRGGDLYIRYENGDLRNLTREAGFGSSTVMQGAGAIAVRDPHVHWNGSKAVFSMVVGAPTQQHQQLAVYWQLYEVTGLGRGQVVAISRVASQPSNYNNVMPAYDSDGRIVFSSDRPRSGERHLYPQQDEYESAPTTSGLWKLDPAMGSLQLLQHSPSGSMDPFVDSFGRVIFTRWDHLMRDQQNDDPSFNTFNWSSEAANSVRTSSRAEIFPEPRINQPGLNRFAINHFFPWQINQDGTQEETLNHLGRHELHRYFTRSFTDDVNLGDFDYHLVNRFNPREALNYLQIHEDLTNPGTYYAIDAPEFTTLSAGQIIKLGAPPSLNPDRTIVDFVTHYDTRSTEPTANNSGHYRNPIVMSNGTLLAVHAAEKGRALNLGTTSNPSSNYRFKLKTLAPGPNGYLVAQQDLVPSEQMARQVRYWSPGVLVEYNGPLWEMSPVEVRARPAPPRSFERTATPEADAFSQAGVSEQAFRAYLRNRNLGVVVVRDMTMRDHADRQQPYNLRVPGGRQNPPNPVGRVYDISHAQVVQGDQIRGRGSVTSPVPGRRVLAQYLHDSVALAENPPPATGAPMASVPIHADGSVAMFVPASRALAWQALSPSGIPVIRERYWLTLQPGEVRACDGCHGVNTTSHSGTPATVQTAQAFVALLTSWRQRERLFVNGFDPSAP